VKTAVLEAVRLHNKKVLPADVPADLLSVAEIVRDSDKIDVFRLVRRHVEENRVNDLLPRLDVDGGYSGELVRELEEEGQGFLPERPLPGRFPSGAAFVGLRPQLRPILPPSGR
jgi:hypothetical protein